MYVVTKSIAGFFIGSWNSYVSIFAMYTVVAVFPLAHTKWQIIFSFKED